MSISPVAGTTIPTITPVFAVNSFDQGWKDRKSAATSTFIHGGTFNDDCGLLTIYNITYFQGYKIGY
ncbi:MAG: hypothetical protein ABJB76_08795 [Candidatus Nitrosocosmicus sp.]